MKHRTWKAMAATGTVLAAGGLVAMTGCKPGGDFSLNDLDGKKVSLGDFRGKTVLVTFWAVG
ncbi:MAG: redoxin domain-containing protein [Phycisphaerales bacterium]|nr:redoxin domain-containing protein [Phycisphaerales bacterium]